MVLSIAIIFFAILEIVNVLVLYFMPGTKLGNGIGVFNAYEKAKLDPEVNALIHYLINWIAGTKLIFILLLLVILLTANTTTKLFSVLALIISIATFFWKLYPAIKRIDQAGQISPIGYSKKLSWMISSFLLIFVLAFLWTIFFD